VRSEQEVFKARLSGTAAVEGFVASSAGQHSSPSLTTATLSSVTTIAACYFPSSPTGFVAAGWDSFRALAVGRDYFKIPAVGWDSFRALAADWDSFRALAVGWDSIKVQAVG